jgi:hypothetical protein
VDGSDPSAAAARYSALVRGPSATFPRGGLWLFPVWYAVMYVALLFETRQRLWFNLVMLAALGAAAAAVVVILAKTQSLAFAADDGGIWLGKNNRAARPLRVGWEQVRQLTISSYQHGSILQVLLNSGATPTTRGRQIASLALVSLPLGIRRARPGLLTVLPDPPRYRVPLARVTPEELRSALSGLAPATLPIEMRL